MSTNDAVIRQLPRKITKVVVGVEGKKAMHRADFPQLLSQTKF